MNFLDAEQLDAATELKVREQLNTLAEIEETEEEETARWERVRHLAPTLWENPLFQKIAATVILGEGRKYLGLP